MAIRWKNCPYCGHQLYFGSGKYVNFGNPLKRCPSCNKIYKDSDIIDWNSTSIFEKIKYCFANGRTGLIGLSWIIALMVMGALECNSEKAFLCTFIAPLTMFVLCFLYVISEARIYYYEGEKSIWDRIAMIVVIIGKCVKWGLVILLFSGIAIPIIVLILYWLNVI